MILRLCDWSPRYEPQRRGKKRALALAAFKAFLYLQWSKLLLGLPPHLGRSSSERLALGRVTMAPWRSRWVTSITAAWC